MSAQYDRHPIVNQEQADHPWWGATLVSRCLLCDDMPENDDPESTAFRPDLHPEEPERRSVGRGYELSEIARANDGRRW